MLRAYICSPYRARTGAELDRNIDYAQEITRRALLAGVAPITPHLYITQCLNDDKKEEREVGITAGMEILKGCDFVIAGIKVRHKRRNEPGDCAGGCGRNRRSKRGQAGTLSEI